MTKSSIPSTLDQGTRPQRSPNPLQALLVLIFRLLLLGIGGSFAALLGIVIAQVHPATNQQPPLLEVLLQQSNRFVRQLRSSVPLQNQTDPRSANSTPASPVPTVAPTSTSPSEAVPPIVTTLTPGKALTITLSTNALFGTEGDTLNPQGQTILEMIVNDLRAYPGATVRIAAYNVPAETNAAIASSQGTLNQAFTHAQKVKTYLANALGDRYHWVVVGYSGEAASPSAAAIAQRRYRRIEITLEHQ
jgi:flagellar motor protein MotB